jgi:enoyl-CoA hydratase/carnithine racemase
MPLINLEYQTGDQIAIITFNRPEKHHAFNEEMMSLLEAHLDLIEQKRETRVIILTASGKESFCAGGDLKYFSGLKTREQALKMSLRMQATLDRLWSGNRVVIAAINGQALGGGCEILTACHFRIAVNSARFSFRHAENGVITGWGGGLQLFRILGHKALHLLLTAETIDAKLASYYGFIDAMVEEGALLPAATALATKIVENSTSAIEAFLELYRRTASDNDESIRQFESDTFADLWVGEDFRTWLGAYLKSKD